MHEKWNASSEKIVWNSNFKIGKIYLTDTTTA